MLQIVLDVPNLLALKLLLLVCALAKLMGEVWPRKDRGFRLGSEILFIIAKEYCYIEGDGGLQGVILRFLYGFKCLRFSST